MIISSRDDDAPSSEVPGRRIENSTSHGYRTVVRVVEKNVFEGIIFYRLMASKSETCTVENVRRVFIDEKILMASSMIARSSIILRL